MIGNSSGTIIWISKFTFCGPNYNSWQEDQLYPVYLACDFSNMSIISLSLFFLKKEKHELLNTNANESMSLSSLLSIIAILLATILNDDSHCLFPPVLS